MFYLEKFRTKRIKNFTPVHVLPALLVFLAFFGITLWSWRTAVITVRDNQARTLDRNAKETIAAIQNRFDAYEDILRGGRGMFNATGYIDRHSWSEFVQSHELPSRYPGIQSAGVISMVTPSNHDAFINNMHSEGYSNFTIHPPQVAEPAGIVSYIEPFSEQNQRLIGFNVYSDSATKAVFDEARDNGDITMSRRIDPHTTLNNTDQQGFIASLPLYNSSGVPSSVPERRQLIVGYLFLFLKTNDLINNLLANNNEEFSYKILPTSNTNDIMYESPLSANKPINDDHKQTREIFINNKSFVLAYDKDQPIQSARERRRPIYSFWGGTIFSVLIGGLIYLLLVSRTHTLAHEEEREIQQIKDELLALASHQLRTPATGVKQYIGMILEGYAGTISEQQRQLLTKAYESNERQLGTINEMLFVARADAGKITLHKERFNLNDLLDDIINEQQGAIKERRQKLNRELPKRPIYIDADKTYLRMALENIISNATKYTPRRGTITIELSKKDVIAIRVSDTGVGVSEQDRHLLFKKFSRIPNELTNQVSGSGIGLYLAKQIIIAHQGSISFDSQPGEGSTVTAILPITINESDKA